jgi:hypothetical protein
VGDGRFDAAGDFGRVMPYGDRSFPLLGGVDSQAEVLFASPQMPQLIVEIDRLLPTARFGPERRGLLRLRALAAHCAEHTDAQLLFTGD